MIQLASQATVLAAGLAGVLGAAGCDRSGRAAGAATAGGATTATDRRQVAAGAPARPAASPANGIWAETCPIPSDAPRAPIGRTAAALTASYSSPAKDERYVLGQALDPVRMSVRNILSAPGDLDRDIREMTWRRRGCELTIWLAERGGREVAVQTLRAPAGGEA